MGDLPPETTPDDDADAPEVRAMRLLETECAPMVGPRHRKRAPYWRPTPPPMVHVVTIPTREWYRADYPEVTARHTVLHMDVNSAYVSAASSALFAHGPLVHTGPLPFNNKPGYWLVETATHWNRPDLPNPLGTGRLRERMWLATPTVKLLDDLTAAGAWPGFEVVDSWTAEVSCRLNSWTDKLRDMRAAAIDAGDTAAEAEIKKGYVFAFQMMLTGTKSKTHRPDWNHTVRAQMLARTWWRMWQCVTQAGAGPIYMGGTDAVEMTLDDVESITKAAPNLLPMDYTGKMLGHFKVNETREPGAGDE